MTHIVQRAKSTPMTANLERAKAEVCQRKVQFVVTGHNKALYCGRALNVQVSSFLDDHKEQSASASEDMAVIRKLCFTTCLSLTPQSSACLERYLSDVMYWNLPHAFVPACLSAGGAGGKGVWGAAGMVYEMEEPDARDPNYDESAQVTEHVVQ